MTLEHRLIVSLVMICGALLGFSTASLEILGGIDWAAQTGLCADSQMALPAAVLAAPTPLFIA